MQRAVTILIIVLVGSLVTPATTAAQPVKRVEYYHLDALGSVRVVTDQQGHEIERHDYLPFGEEWPQPTFRSNVTFIGKERDAESALQYFGARYDSTALGRFTTVDPALDSNAAVVDPQRWNRYSYALGNPQTHVDPDGREVPVKIGGRLSGLGLEAVRVSEEGGTKTFLVFAGIVVGTWAGPSVVAGGSAIAAGCLFSVGCQAAVLGVAAGAAESPISLPVGEAAHVVYRSLNAAGDVQYVGMTVNFARRLGEHLAHEMDIVPLIKGLSKSDARAVEQALIDIHGLGKLGGTLLNKINSIAKRNPLYERQLRRGYELLDLIGYKYGQAK